MRSLIRRSLGFAGENATPVYRTGQNRQVAAVSVIKNAICYELLIDGRHQDWRCGRGTKARIYAGRSSAKMVRRTALIAVTLFSLAGCGPSVSDDETQLEIDCLDWRYKTLQQKHLDDPGTRDWCLKYLSSRTPEQIEADRKFEQSLLDETRKETEIYNKEHGGTKIEK